MKKISGIYCIRNKIDGKIYIGRSNNIYLRWSHHKSELRRNIHGNKYLQRSWNKYKEDSFEFNIIEECSEIDSYELEKYYINKYDSCDEKYGYNLSSGGEHNSTGYFNNSLSKKVYQYDLNGNFIKEWTSISEVERQLNIDNSGISMCCKGKIKYFHNNQWRYEYSDSIDSINVFDLRSKNKKNKGKKVYQYSINGEYIGEYNNSRVAKEELNIGTSINSAAKNHKTAGGYQWFYEYKGLNVDPVNIHAKKHHRTTKVNKYDLNDNYIKTYDSLKEAAKDVGLKSTTGIIACINGERKTSGGYKWKSL